MKIRRVSGALSLLGAIPTACAIVGHRSEEARHARAGDGAQLPEVGSAEPLCADLWKCVGNFWSRRSEHTSPTAAVQLRELPDKNATRVPVMTWLHLMLRGYKTPVMASPQFAQYLNHYREPRQKMDFLQRSGKVAEAHDQQTVEIARSNREHHKQMVLFGEIEPIELVMKLAFTHDPTDIRVGVGSQWLHMLQFFNIMKLDGVAERELLFAAVIHDLGKLGSLVDSDELSDGCSTGLDYSAVPDGGGMDSLTIAFDHHDFGADKMRRYVSPRVYRIMRYHCFRDIMMEEKAAELGRIMTAEEKAQAEEIRQFFQYDQLSKSTWVMPQVDISEIKELLRDFLPPKIVF